MPDRPGRLRWQIELCFKEWKSSANLHQFDTANAQHCRGPHVGEPVRRGRSWTSVDVASRKSATFSPNLTVLCRLSFPLVQDIGQANTPEFLRSMSWVLNLR